MGGTNLGSPPANNEPSARQVLLLLEQLADLPQAGVVPHGRHQPRPELLRVEQFRALHPSTSTTWCEWCTSRKNGGARCVPREGSQGQQFVPMRQRKCAACRTCRPPVIAKERFNHRSIEIRLIIEIWRMAAHPLGCLSVVASCHPARGRKEGPPLRGEDCRGRQQHGRAPRGLREDARSGRSPEDEPTRGHLTRLDGSESSPGRPPCPKYGSAGSRPMHVRFRF